MKSHTRKLANPWLLLTVLVVTMALSVVILTGRDSSGTSGDKPALPAQSQSQGQGQLQAAAAIPVIPTGTDVAVSPSPSPSPTSTPISTNVSTSATVVIAPPMWPMLPQWPNSESNYAPP